MPAHSVLGLAEAPSGFEVAGRVALVASQPEKALRWKHEMQGVMRDTLVVMSREEADRRGITPLATIRGYAGHAQAPEWFTTAPAGAIATLLQNTGLKADDVDLWELNEACAVVALVNQDRVGIAHERLNTRGGAIALGHPIGCSGARVLTTLLYALKQDGKRRGVASLCIGGGEAVALMVER